MMFSRGLLEMRRSTYFSRLLACNLTAAALFCLLSLVFMTGARADEGRQAGYAGKWLVIAGKHRSLDDAWRKKIDLEMNAEILLSTYYDGIEPGWYLVVVEAFDHKPRAVRKRRVLKRKGMDCAVENAGSLFDFSQGAVRVGKLSLQPGEGRLRDCHVHKGMQAPDGKSSLSFKFQDPTSDMLVLNRAEEVQPVEGLFFKTREVFWSPGSGKVAFADDDLYANSGNQRFIIVDVDSAVVSEIETTQLEEWKGIGKRTRFGVSGVCWVSAGDQVRFDLSVDYMGSSGHPGIDEERKERLKEKFGQSDPVLLGRFAVFLRPVPADLEARPKDIPLFDPDKFGYIDEAGKMVIKPRFDEAGPFVGGRAKVKIGGKEKYIDKRGRFVKGPSRKTKKPQPSATGDMGDPKPAKIGERYGYMDSSGMIVIDPLFDEAGKFESGIAMVRIGERSGFIDKQGKTLGDRLWDLVFAFSGKLARVEEKGRFGFIDRKGSVIVAPEYGAAGDFSEGLAPVRIAPR